jgi:hypothetical protein
MLLQPVEGAGHWHGSEQDAVQRVPFDAKLKQSPLLHWSCALQGSPMFCVAVIEASRAASGGAAQLPSESEGSPVPLPFMPPSPDAELPPPQAVTKMKQIASRLGRLRIERSISASRIPLDPRKGESCAREGTW